MIENMTNELYNIIEQRFALLEEIIMGKNQLRLKELRTESRLTQEQLANYLDVDQSLVTKLENGTRSLNVTLLEKLCNLFGCSDSYLLGMDDTYVPLSFAFRTKGIQTEDLESIAAVNKIIMNLRSMNEMMGEE